jgi:hypothetical protein
VVPHTHTAGRDYFIVDLVSQFGFMCETKPNVGLGRSGTCPTGVKITIKANFGEYGPALMLGLGHTSACSGVVMGAKITIKANFHWAISLPHGGVTNKLKHIPHGQLDTLRLQQVVRNLKSPSPSPLARGAERGVSNRG